MKRELRSAGILLFHRSGPSFEVFLAHPGGPVWTSKDIGAWTIPKGEIEAGEDALDAAIREFGEETGIPLAGPFFELGTIRQKNKKIVHAWACEGDADPSKVVSNTTQIRFGGKQLTIPEVDRCEWFDPETAMIKINPAQAELILRLSNHLIERG